MDINIKIPIINTVMIYKQVDFGELNMSEPKISVIMGIYNCENTLSEAIDSIIAQTYKNWNIVMCDDCSTDGTYNVAKQYVDMYPEKFILLKNDKNMGLNYTLNHCLRYADGDYIARMDGDDISYPDRFEKEMDFLFNNPEYSIVSTQMEYFDNYGVFGKSSNYGTPTKENIVMGITFCHATCIIKKTAYDAVSGYSVSDKLLRVEDYDLWVKMYSAGYKGYNLPQVLYKMRDDRNAIKRRKFKYRVNESRVSVSAVRKLNVSKKYYIFALKPIIVGILPEFIYTFLHKKRLKGNSCL